MKFSLTDFFEKTSFKTLFTIAISILIIISLIYLIIYAGNCISGHESIFGNYGSFIAGITSILSLGVFIFLTFYVAGLGDINSKTQIDAQKKIMLAQFRKSELDKLNEILEKPSFDIAKLPEHKELINDAGLYLAGFLGQGDSLFPILKRKDVDEIMKNLHELTSDLYRYLSQQNQLDKNEWGKQIKTYMHLKHRLIYNLQKFIIDDLNNIPKT